MVGLERNHAMETGEMKTVNWFCATKDLQFANELFEDEGITVYISVLFEGKNGSIITAYLMDKHEEFWTVHVLPVATWMHFGMFTCNLCFVLVFPV